VDEEGAYTVDIRIGMWGGYSAVA